MGRNFNIIAKCEITSLLFTRSVLKTIKQNLILRNFQPMKVAFNNMKLSKLVLIVTFYGMMKGDTCSNLLPFSIQKYKSLLV